VTKGSPHESAAQRQSRRTVLCPERQVSHLVFKLDDLLWWVRRFRPVVRVFFRRAVSITSAEAACKA
jgi:hypothetical protein